MVKSGIKTTEFWVTALVAIAPNIMAFLQQLSPDTAAWVSGIAVAVYTVARAFVKGSENVSNK